MIQEIESSIETLTQEIQSVQDKINANTDLISSAQANIGALSQMVAHFSLEELTPKNIESSEIKEKELKLSLRRANKIATTLDNVLANLNSQLDLEKAELFKAQRQEAFNILETLADEANDALDVWRVAMDALNQECTRCSKEFRGKDKLTDYGIFTLTAQKQPKVKSFDGRTFQLEYSN